MEGTLHVIEQLGQAHKAALAALDQQQLRIAELEALVVELRSAGTDG